MRLALRRRVFEQIACPTDRRSHPVNGLPDRGCPNVNIDTHLGERAAMIALVCRHTAGKRSWTHTRDEAADEAAEGRQPPLGQKVTTAQSDWIDSVVAQETDHRARSPSGWNATA